LQVESNIAAIATARLATVVVSALGGKNTQIKVADFLPFPDDMRDNSEMSASPSAQPGVGLQISKETAVCFFRLLQAGKLPAAFAGQLGPHIGRWKRLIN